MPGGWDVEQSVTLVRALAGVGVDLIDASSGGLHHQAVMPTDVDYQYAIARLLRERTGVLTAAVGRITDAQQAEGIIREGGADAVFLARQMLRDPHWPLRAAHELGASITWPKQYARAASWTS
jgi:2,4-dienoyl-CoA reductase-like NADH-dependent reductase (Old Yellow Enzyme family)